VAGFLSNCHSFLTPVYLLIGGKTQQGFVLVNKKLKMPEEIHTQQAVHT
jgi:hypothetical protein